MQKVLLVSDYVLNNRSTAMNKMLLNPFNNKRALTIAMAIPLLVGSSMLHARCAPAERPIIPEYTDNATEMQIVKDAVTAYMEKSKAYIQCQRRNKKRNQAIDEMKLVAADYNVLIALYKENEEMQVGSR